MKVPVIVVAELDSSYPGHPQRSLYLQDQSDGRRLINPIEFVMSVDQERDWSGKVQNKRGDLVIDTIDSVFGGRPRVRGELTLSVNGSKP